MDRMTEYRQLLDQLDGTPPALDGAVDRARARARRSRTGRRLGIPAASLCGAAAAFVLLVNLSVPFARACGSVPVLRELAAAAALSPTLKAAVEHDYVQPLGLRAEDDGFAMELSYLMADRGQLVLFARVTGPEEYDDFLPSARLLGPDGEGLPGWSTVGTSVVPGELSGALTLIYNGEGTPALPETLRLECTVGAYDDDRPGEWATAARFTFEFPLDERFRDRGRTVEVDRWLELDGNRIRVAALEVAPTHARLVLEQDPANGEELRSLDFWLEDGDGARYERGSASGLSAVGDTYLVESPWFADSEELTLHIAGARWLDRELTAVTVDLKTLESGPLPEGVTLTGVRRQGDDVELSFAAPVNQPFESNITLPDGTRDYAGMGLTQQPGEGGSGLYRGYLLLKDYPYDTVTLTPAWSRTTAFAAPVTVELLP